jgi:hypothetical protein
MVLWAGVAAENLLDHVVLEAAAAVPTQVGAGTIIGE